MIGAVVKRAADPRVVRSAAMWNKVPVRTIYPQASSNIISGVPRTRLPFAEKVAGGIFITSCIVATPMWILTHMDNYRGGPLE